MKKTAEYAPTDKTGKVFMMLGHGMRRCLICEEWFSREGSREHNDVVCYPHAESQIQRARQSITQEE
jgi:hypothetical protein